MNNKNLRNDVCYVLTDAISLSSRKRTKYKGFV